MKELQYLNKYFIKYKFHFLLGIFITIVAQIFSLFTPKLVSQSFQAIERSYVNAANNEMIKPQSFCMLANRAMPNLSNTPANMALVKL